jgi:Na+-translocating ferredoxin:NAD+ oxidoreductase RnfG subunit
MIKDLLHKGLVLMVVAALAGLLLAATYDLTAPRIASLQKEAQQLAAQEVGGTPIAITVKGYSGDIKMLVGLDPDGQVTGVKILAQKETPGLGSLATSTVPLKGQDFTFLGQFRGKSLQDKFKAKKDIVAITGATITSQAIANGVKVALQQAAGNRKD